MLDRTISSYLDSAAARTPAPGGGSVAALSGALGAAMASMPAHFTLGKRGYEQVQDEVKKILEESEKARKKLAELAEEDIAAYRKVSEAYKMPGETEEQKQIKKERIAKAAEEAMKVPFETARQCCSVIKTLGRLAETGNKNLISDVGVSAYLLDAALNCARLNVEINLKDMTDESFKKKKRELLNRWCSESRTVLEEVEGKVSETLAT